ncbi:hypothetical protein PAAG_11165 [Paracoccidioides lutzii Pb01]|uniref:Uncharacterized protein n=1 Tax=Paracoccidioides lutzii (strain ATCC MYA-826 / Pb01) TaxID=502779 RepID=A0A0A2V6K9_PARBA|nr:hypothetical protein PAAG_11165 [Paracoccidioides lutzii Pb01]KGQ01992.1 hypothetical protein PAAG_11165 [Paracoccidioides lutzii Pb01]
MVGWVILHNAPELVVIQRGLAAPTPYPCPTTRVKESAGLYPDFEIMHENHQGTGW